MLSAIDTSSFSCVDFAKNFHKKCAKKEAYDQFIYELESDEDEINGNQNGPTQSHLNTDPGDSATNQIYDSHYDASHTDVCLPLNAVTTHSGKHELTPLTYDQVQRLDTVLNSPVYIHGRGNYPTIEASLYHLIALVQACLQTQNVCVQSVRLNGGVASYILSQPDDLERATYNDVDLIYMVQLAADVDFDRVKTAVLDSLMKLLPSHVCRKKITHASLKLNYVQKMVKVDEKGDCWSLISLSQYRTRNVELKFVHNMRRQFEFSVDSFQILLDSIMDFYKCCSNNNISISENFYPTVFGISVYGDFNTALYHLHQRIISTSKPEEIRGGGLLKYCYLLVKGFRIVGSPNGALTLERYMCSRFFIDFPDIDQQRMKLETYLCNHFSWNEQNLCYMYLLTLHRVVSSSTVCLMNFERFQTLGLISEIASKLYLHITLVNVPVQCREVTESAVTGNRPSIDWRAKNQLEFNCSTHDTKLTSLGITGLPYVLVYTKANC